LVKDEFGEDGEAPVVLEEDKLGLGLRRRRGDLYVYVSHEVQGLKQREGRTRIFFKATNTLGVDTTATVISAVAPSRSSLAYR
jgi:hypothetical protein